MFNYIANAPDSLDLVNRIRDARANQLKNAIYAAQEPQIRAQTAYQLADTALLPQQRDAALMAAYARYARVPFQNYKDTTESLTPGAKAQNIADHPEQIAAINKMAIDALGAGADPFMSQMMSKYGIGVQPKGSVSPMMQQTPSGASVPMVSSNQPQASSVNGTNLQNAAMAQDPNDPNSVPVINSPSTPASNLKTVASSESQQKSMTESQKNKLPFSQNLNVTLQAMKDTMDGAVNMAGSGIDIPTEYGKMAANSLGAKFDIDPKFIKYKTYMDSVETLINQLRQTYGASIQPQQLEHFREMFTPSMFFDTPDTARQKIKIAFNNIDNELKTFKQPVSNLVSDQFTKQQEQGVSEGVKQIQQEALKNNAQAGQPNAMAGGDRIRVISPDGRTGSIPSSKLKDYLKKGYKAA